MESTDNDGEKTTSTDDQTELSEHFFLDLRDNETLKFVLKSIGQIL